MRLPRISFRNPEWIQDLSPFSSWPILNHWDVVRECKGNPQFTERRIHTKTELRVNSKFWSKALGSALGLAVRWKLQPFPCIIYLPVPQYLIRKGLLWCLLPSDSQTLLMPFSSTLTVSQICLLSGKVQYKSICWFSAMQGQYSSELSKVHWANTQHRKKVTIQKSSTILPSSWLLFSNKKVTEGAAGRRQERPEEQSSSFNFPFCEGTEQCLKTTWAACSSVLNSACSPGQMTHLRCTQSWSSHERCLSFFCNLWHFH